MRRFPLIIVAIATLVILASFVRIQPSGFARVIGRRVLYGRIGIAPPWPRESCLVPVVNNQLYIRRTVDLTAADGSPLRANVTFVTSQAVDCRAITSLISEGMAEWAGRETTERLVRNVRVESEAASDYVRARLQRSGIAAHDVAVRLIVDPMLARVIPQPDVVSRTRTAPPLIFIGLDGADWQLLDDYIRSGAMPNLARLVAGGTSGTLRTEHPPLSPLLWTTMMTGVSPLQHQILDFVRFNPATHVKEPITSSERRAPAIWNMATNGAKRVAVFGLWATYPAEAVIGTLVSDRLFAFLYSEEAPPPGAVYPPSREAWAREQLADAQRAIDLPLMRTFLPDMSQEEFDEAVASRNPYSSPPNALRRILVDTEVYRRLVQSELQRGVPDLTVAYFEGTDTIGHIFAPFAPARQANISEGDFARYSHVPELYFRHVDAMLGDLTRLATASHARIMIASDHGFHWKEGRPTELSSYATATAAKWHRIDGIYLLWGPGIAASNGHAFAGGVRQVCATLLDLSGLPTGVGVKQPALPGAPPADRTPIDYAKFYTPPPNPAQPTTKAASEALANLKALGYIGSAESSRPAIAITSTKTAGALNNEGLVLKNEGKIDAAIAAFEQAMRIDPNLASAQWNLSDLLFQQKRDLERSNELMLSSLRNGLPDAPKYVIERAIWYQRHGDAKKSLALVDAAVGARGNDPELRMFRGRYRVELHDCAGALQEFRIAQQLKPEDPVALASAGLAEMCLGDRAAAADYFRRSLALNPNQPVLQRFLAEQ